MQKGIERENRRLFVLVILSVLSIGLLLSPSETIFVCLLSGIAGSAITLLIMGD